MLQTVQELSDLKFMKSEIGIHLKVNVLRDTLTSNVLLNSYLAYNLFKHDA